MALLALFANRGLNAQPGNKNFGALLDRYQRGEFGAAVTEAAKDEQDLRSVIAQLTAKVPVLNPNSPESQLRRLTIAAFSLEIVMATRNSLFRDAGSQKSGRVLLEWACSLLRRGQTPLPAERLWHQAAFGVIEGASDWEALETHVGHVAKRFPDDPRLPLTKALVWELKSWPDDRREGAGQSGPPELVPAFRLAVVHRDVQDETNLRWGFFELRRGNAKTALGHLDDIGATDDRFIDYLRHLFRGRALERLNRVHDAVEAYHRAVLVQPTAQTARMALAGALVANQQRQEAASLLDGVLAGPLDVLADPWFVFGAADQRFYPDVMTQLRREVRR